MNGVNKTLYIPLYGKACVSRKGLFLRDPMAEKIWGTEGFALGGKARSKWLAYYMGIRAAVFDQWTRQQMDAMPEAVVVHIGCGLDSRALRVDAGQRKWYDVDFPAVIRERKRYFSETACYKMLEGDAAEAAWLQQIPERKSAIVVMEGISMYLALPQLQALMAALWGHFSEVTLLMDCYTEKAARLSKYRNPVWEVGVTEVYGLDQPRLLQRGGAVFAGELPMMPECYVNELQGMEKTIFRKLYAGKFAGQLYKLYAYKTAAP